MLPSGDLLAEAPLVLAPDVDDHLVAGPQAVALGRGLVLVGLEREGRLAEDVAAEELDPPPHAPPRPCRAALRRGCRARAGGVGRLRRQGCLLPAAALLLDALPRALRAVLRRGAVGLFQPLGLLGRYAPASSSRPICRSLLPACRASMR